MLSLLELQRETLVYKISIKVVEEMLRRYGFEQEFKH